MDNKKSGVEGLEEKYQELLSIENIIWDLYLRTGADNKVVYIETLDNGDVINHTKEMIIKDKINELHDKIVTFIYSSLTDNFGTSNKELKEISFYNNKARKILSRISEIIERYFKEDANKFKL